MMIIQNRYRYVGYVENITVKHMAAHIKDLVDKPVFHSKNVKQVR